MSILRQFFQTLTQSMMEAQRRKAAYNTAQQLRYNRDFAHWSFEELYRHILDDKNPIGIDKKPII